MTEVERADSVQFWSAAQPISDVFPYTSPSGMVINEFYCECFVCAAVIDADKVKVKITKHSNQVETLSGKGARHHCKTVTDYILRFRPEGILETMMGHTWQRMSLSTPERLQKWWLVIRVA